MTVPFCPPAHPGDGTRAFVRAGLVPDDTLALFDISASAWEHVPASDTTRYETADDAAEYAAKLSTLPAFLDRTRPDLVLYQAGMDPHEADVLGGIPGMTWDALAARDRFVFDTCLAQALPIVPNLAGGYQEDGSTVRGHVETFRQAWAALGDHR